MALAGVPYQIGREPRRMAGVNDRRARDAGGQRGRAAFTLPLGLHVDPYRVPGNAASGTSHSSNRDPSACPNLARETPA